MTTTPDSALARHATSVRDDLDAQIHAWDKGFTRRTFIKGVGAAGVVALGSQLVTTKAAFAAPGTTNGNTVINISLRGAADGLRMLIPASSSLGSDYLARVRPALVPATGELIPLTGSGGWALNKNLGALAPLWNSGELAFVPAVSTQAISRSHFDAQRWLDTGGLPTGSSGWLDRVLAGLGPGTTFRAIAEGGTAPATFNGVQEKLVLSSLSQFSFPCPAGAESRTTQAIETLYRGVDGTLPGVIDEALTALAATASLRVANTPQNGARYPAGGLATALADIATMLRGEVGVQVVSLDVGGWDTHTGEVATLDPQIAALSAALAAFMQDLGPARRSRVTVVVGTEFGRRVAQNGWGGTDHGHGGVMMMLGGGLRKAQVAGTWQALSDATLDQGDVRGLNDPFQVFAELARARLGVGTTKKVFPDLTYAPLKLFKSAA